MHADNVEFYAHNGVPFVVGTTGGDREKLLADAESASCYAVIAPQMGKQVCTHPTVQSVSRALSCWFQRRYVLREFEREYCMSTGLKKGLLAAQLLCVGLIGSPCTY